MALKTRIEKLENVISPEKITITTNLWDEKLSPWPETEEQKKAYEATRPGVKMIWVEAKPGQNRRFQERR